MALQRSTIIKIMGDLIDYKNLFGDIQQKVVDILKEDDWFSNRGITILSENLLDIDFQIKNALCK